MTFGKHNMNRWNLLCLAEFVGGLSLLGSCYLALAYSRYFVVICIGLGTINAALPLVLLWNTKGTLLGENRGQPIYSFVFCLCHHRRFLRVVCSFLRR
jgi:hypothetical protein